MDSQKQIVEKLKDANNILVTVQSNPTIDALSACIGLTLFLNELGKHATAVFSGEVPHVLEFLQPEKTIEANTNSLRDFIISLDKSKADKLRYKVEDKVVKIFITPYKTSITDRDLEFSQGDFNVDVVIAIGVHSQDELDQAITAHGRILHDATVMSVNDTEGDALGSVTWIDKDASSLSEMTASLVDPLGKDKLDNQIATAFLTGIVEQTERFSNNRTTPKTMSISAKLLTAGANQELVASKLAEPEPEPEEPIEEPYKPEPEPTAEPEAKPEPAPPKKDPGTLEIDHTHDDPFAADVDDAAAAGAENDGPKAPAAPADAPHHDLDQPPEKLEVQEESKDDAGAASNASDDDSDDDSEAEPEVPDDAVKALHELQRAQAEKAKAKDAGDEHKAEIEAAAEKAAEDFLRNKQINIDDQGHLRLMTPEHRQFLGNTKNVDTAPNSVAEEKPSNEGTNSKFVLSPPSMGGTLTANSRPDDLNPEPATDPLSMPKTEAPVLEHGTVNGSKSLEPTADADTGSARDAVKDAIAAAPAENKAKPDPLANTEEKIVTNPNPATPEPLVQMDDLPAEPESDAKDKPEAPVAPSTPASEPLAAPLGSEDAHEDGHDETATADAGKPMDMPLPPSLNLPAPNLAPASNSPNSSPNSPPPVPPPMMPQPNS